MSTTLIQLHGVGPVLKSEIFNAFFGFDATSVVHLGDSSRQTDSYFNVGPQWVLNSIL